MEEPILFLCAETDNLFRAYRSGEIGNHPVLSGEQLLEGEPRTGVHAVFSTWGMPALTEEQIAYLNSWEMGTE